ncbi:unnamed protein product [Pocillopora meandrina]|uniref:Fork-head domain-containing protein n=1 Tax=Pocillopora meandrina TaxID=46732 RepID=A0AAU9XAI9_9CNID|nr:unnamed protein product [Pocillopora meandrina]
MSAFSPVSSYEKASDYFPSVPSVSTVTWPSAVPTAFELGPWYSWGLPHSKLNCHGPPAPAAVAPLDYTSFWPTVPSLGSCGFFLPSGSSLARSYEKPSQSYIGLIAEAILGSPEKKLVLSDIYSYILTRYPYFRTKGSGWRNSIRHNLSLNDCFIKAGRSPNGKGHFWTICPMYYEDFLHGDYRRRRSGKCLKLDLKSERLLSDSHRYFALFSEEPKPSVLAQRETSPPRYEQHERDVHREREIDCETVEQSSSEHERERRRVSDKVEFREFRLHIISEKGLPDSGGVI